MKKELAIPFGTSSMQHRSEYVDNLITTTWYDVRNSLATDIWDITPLLDILNSKGKIKSKIPNGRYFEIPIAYAKADQNQKWFGRGDTFGSEEKELWTTLQYHRKNFGDSIVRYWADEMMQKGEAQILNYASNLLENHMETMKSTLATSLWSENPAGNEINSLPTLITTDPTSGTVGGLTRSANEYVQNLVYNMDGKSLATELIPTMRTFYNNCSMKRGKGRTTPDIILTTQAIYEEYEDQAIALGQIQLANNKGTARADLGLGGLSYKGAEMYWDPECPEGQMYFLNSDTIEFVYDPDAYMEMTDWKKRHNSLDKYAQVVTVCNLVFNNFQKNGVIYNMTTA